MTTATRTPRNGLGRRLAIAVLSSSILGLQGCDQQGFERAMKQLRDFWIAVKSDGELFKGVEVGASTEDDVRRQAGAPETVRETAQGGRRLEYPRGPEGATTWMVTIGAEGKVAKIEQVLTAENFARVRPGMDREAIRHLLGKPTRVHAFALKSEEVWSYRWWETRTERGIFNVHFDPSGVVATTSRSDDPSMRDGG